MKKMGLRSINNFLVTVFTVFLLSACSSTTSNYIDSGKLNFEMLVGYWDLEKIIKGKKAIEGGVVLDYVTKNMTIEKGRFNTYTNSHIPWGSKYQTELKSDSLIVYNGTNSPYFVFRVKLNKDGKHLILENLFEDEEEYYIKR